VQLAPLQCLRKFTLCAVRDISTIGVSNLCVGYSRQTINPPNAQNISRKDFYVFLCSHLNIDILWVPSPPDEQLYQRSQIRNTGYPSWRCCPADTPELHQRSNSDVPVMPPEIRVQRRGSRQGNFGFPLSYAGVVEEPSGETRSSISCGSSGQIARDNARSGPLGPMPSRPIRVCRMCEIYIEV
jgi:hypothetical protein